MKLKLFKKYFLTTSLIIIFSLAIMLMILSFVLNDYMSKSKQKTLQSCCSEVTTFIDGAVTNGEDLSVARISEIINSVSAVSDSDVFVADDSGVVVACSCAEWNESGNCMHSSKKVSYSDFLENSNDSGMALITLGIYEDPHYVAAKSLYGNYGTVYSATTVSTVTNLLSSIVKLYLISATIPIILMFVSIYTMTYRVTKPLKSMSEASKAMAKGDFSKRIPVMSDDEIGELSMSFNMMTNNLSRLEGMRRSFVANVSHELKTPMTTIGGFIDGILDGTIEKDKQDYYLSIVSGEVKRLSRLVQSMLSMARLESGEFALKYEQFDLRELIFTTVISQEQRIEKSSLNITGLDAIPNVSITADKDLLHQVIYNLVDNAIKFNKPDGEIVFRLSSDEKTVNFTIINSGDSIPEKDMPFIFERFYKVDKSRSASKNSTGLGLYIVKTIITAHGGSIKVSVRDSATSFTVTLPIAKTETE